MATVQNQTAQQTQNPMAVDYSTLAGTLGPLLQFLGLGEAQQGQDLEQLRAQVQQAQAQAQSAGQQYTQASQAPQEQGAPNFFNQLLGNTASVIGQEPDYGKRAYEQGQGEQKQLIERRKQNLDALASNYEQQAKAAEKLGNIEATAQWRSKLDSIMKARTSLTQEAMKGAGQIQGETQKQEGRLDLDAQRNDARWTELQSKIGAGAYAKAGRGGADLDDAKEIAEAIMRGDQPPDLKSMYRIAGPIRAELARRGFPLYAAQQDQVAYGQYYRSQNTGRQLQLRQNVDRAYESLDIIDDLNDELAKLIPRGRFPILNRAAINAAKAGLITPEAQDAAVKLEGQIADVTQELSNVFSGGYAPTDKALQLAIKNLNTAWTPQTLRAMTGQLRSNLQIRRNSIIHSSAVAPSNPLGSPTQGPPWTPPPPSPGGEAGNPADPLGILPGRK